MNFDLTQRYNKFLGALHGYKCNMQHFITYRKNKIANIAFDQLVSLPTYIPQSLQLQKIVIDNDNDKYTLYKNNVHHWTTGYVWRKIIPMLAKLLNVDLAQYEFIKIPFIWNTCDFSYHNLMNASFKIHSFDNAKVEVGDHEILRNTNNCPYMSISCYHALFKLSHQSGLIENLGNASIQKIVVNCDSMAIPILPILACFCKQLLVIDNRTNANRDYMRTILDFCPQYYISIFTEENFLVNQKHIKQIL